MREQILKSARVVIAMGGQPTVADFAAAAGTSRARFYRHFQSRDALFEALEVAPEPGARDRVLSAPLEIGRAHRLGQLSMAELADRARVSRPTLYHLVPGNA